jgi:hypothetical protein
MSIMCHSSSTKNIIIAVFWPKSIFKNIKTLAFRKYVQMNEKNFMSRIFPQSILVDEKSENLNRKRSLQVKTKIFNFSNVIFSLELRYITILNFFWFT